MRRWEQIQREHSVLIAGPTTLTAILSSLQMGFRTLSIEKRSSEVWRLLEAVKTEFGKFEVVIKKTIRNLDGPQSDGRPGRTDPCRHAKAPRRAGAPRFRRPPAVETRPLGTAADEEEEGWVQPTPASQPEPRVP